MQGQAQGCFLPGQNFPEYKSITPHTPAQEYPMAPHAYGEMSTFPAAVLVLYRISLTPIFPGIFPGSSSQWRGTQAREKGGGKFSGGRLLRLKALQQKAVLGWPHIQLGLDP